MSELESLKVLRASELVGMHKSIGELADAIQEEVDKAYMRLPVDANGSPIRPGDKMVLNNGIAVTVASVSCAAHQHRPSFHLRDGTSYEAAHYEHAKPRTLDDIMDEYAELASKQEVKDYFDVSDELRKIQREQFRDEPERELYKEVNGYEFYIELPYDEMWIMTDKVEVKHHSYSYMYKRPNGTTVHSCSSLCGYPREWAIEQIEKTIESELRDFCSFGKPRDAS